MAKIKLLSTKKLNPAIASNLQDSGIEITEKEFIRVQPVNLETDLPVLSSNDIIIFTSQNAVIHYPVKLQHPVNVCCTSGETKAAVQKKFPDAIILATADNAADLAQKIISFQPEHVLFVCGDKRRYELPDALRNNNIRITELIVYTTTETPVQLNEDFDAILFFSPSAVRSFFKLNVLKSNAVLFAIGKTTANTIKEFCSNETITSDYPDQEHLVKKVRSRFSLSHC